MEKAKMAALHDQPGARTQYNMRYVWAISLVAALGGLMFGYDFVVISGAESFYERFFPIHTAFNKGWAMSSALVGCLLGAIVSGTLSDKLGRKWLLVFSAFVFVASSIGTALIHAFWAFNLWRIAGGMAIGMASNLSPMYISEISPAAVRGRLVTMNQLLIVIGGLLAQAVNFGIAAGIGAMVDDKALQQHTAKDAAIFDARSIAEELAWQVPDFQRERLRTDFEKRAARHSGLLDVHAVKRLVEELNSDRAKEKLDSVTAHDKAVEMAGRGIPSWNVDPGWRWMFGVTALPACFFFILMFFVPESPRWLVKNSRSSRARQILARIGGPAYADREVASIEETLVGEIQKVNFRDLFEPRMRKILVLGMILAMAQQWCGLNVILYYAVSIFRDAGENVDAGLLNIVYMGTINLIFTIIAIFTVDRLGRRILMLVGAAGLTATLSLIGAGFHWGYSSAFILVLCLATCACFAMTYGPVVWVLLSEIFPNRIRGAAMSISVFSLWTACFIMILTSPMLRETLGKAGSFWIYAAICLFVFVFIYFRVPETKGKSLEQIEKELVD
jgi:MFS family permease